MSAAGGKAATLAAVTGAGSGLLSRFRTREAQAERLADLAAQRRFYEGRNNKVGMAEVDRLIAEINTLSASPAVCGRPRLVRGAGA